MPVMTLLDREHVIPFCTTSSGVERISFDTTGKTKRVLVLIPCKCNILIERDQRDIADDVLYDPTTLQ